MEYISDMSNEELSKEDEKTYKTYENKCRAKCDFHDLIRAKEIMKDEERKKMAMAYGKEYRDKIDMVTKESK